MLPQYIERKKEMLNLRLEGKTYRELALKYRISFQRVQQILGKADKNHFKPISKKLVPIDSLRKYMDENCISFRELVRQIFGYYHSEYYKRLCRQLNNKEFLPLHLIKKLLKITNLTFEEMFMEENKNGDPNN